MKINLELDLKNLIFWFSLVSFMFGGLITGVALNKVYRTHKNEFLIKIHQLELKNQELEGKIESDLRLIKELRRQKR